MASDPSTLATPKEVAAQLSISPSTLRVWSARLASLLTTDANPPKLATTGRIGRRLYNPSDVATLTRARDLLANGLTLVRVLDVLRTEPAPLAVQEPRNLATSDVGRSLVTLATLATEQTDAIADLERRVHDLEHRPSFWHRLFTR